MLTAALRVLCALTLPVPVEIPRIGSEAQIVHVEVVVTDKSGRPVPGLSAADFLLFEDDVRVPIVAFRPPAREPTAARALPRPAPADVPVQAPAAADVVEPVTYVVYVDNPNLTVAGRRRLLRGLSPFLTAQLSTGRARVLVLAEDRGLRPLTSLTSEPQAVTHALGLAEQAPVQGHLVLSDERSTIEAVKNVIETIPQPCIEALPLLQDVVRHHARAREQHLERTLARFEQLSAALGMLQGEKALLYLSDGFDQRPGLHLFDQLGQICPDAGVELSKLMAPALEFDLARSLQRMAARANAARVTIFPLDGEGLRGHSSSDVSYADRRYTPSPSNDSIRESNRRSGPWIMARETGGRAIANTNDPAQALAKVADEIAGRYALGFSPAHDADGQTHRIRVALNRRGLQARYRPSYFHGERAEAVVSRTLAALFFGLEEDGLGVSVALELPASGSNASQPRQASVRIVVPLSRLAPAREPGEPHARLHLIMALRRPQASAGREAEVREKWIDVPLSGPSSNALGEASREFVVELPLEDDDPEIGVGLHDVFSQRASFRRVRAHP